MSAEVSGFWDGLIDGLLLILSMLGWVFDPPAEFYTISNNGGSYWYGWVLGGLPTFVITGTVLFIALRCFCNFVFTAFVAHKMTSKK
ncbi:hypothetical protein [Neptuniibacter sp. QD37_11]|uniref:hypothetical protein n=1 Tax=Neptuniibacter sp. QD37_11 TaxID=3398209 RepID=UPI0039F4ED99